MSSRSAKESTALLRAALVLAALWAAGPAAAADELDYGLEQHSLLRIVLAGNRSLPDHELKALLKIHEPSWLHPFRIARYQPDLLDGELKLIERYYRQRGFHTAAVALDSIARDPRGRGDIVHISIREGPRAYLDRLEFIGAAPLTDEQLRRGLRYVEGRPVPADLNDLGPDLYLLRRRYLDDARLHARIEPDLVVSPTADPMRLSAALTYRIEPGPAVRLGTIEVEGNSLTRTDLIERALPFAPGEPLRWHEAEEAQRRLLDTALFRDVSLLTSSADSTGEVANLTVQVVERSPGFYEFGFGIGSRERLRVLGAWGHNNLWGTGQRLQLRARPYVSYERILNNPNTSVTPQFNYRFDLLHVYPYLLGGRLALNTNLYLERKTRGESGLNLRTLGLSFGTALRGGPFDANSVSFRLEETEPSLHPDAPADLDSAFVSNQISRSRTRSIVIHGANDRRDDLFRPARGTLLSAEGAIAGGLMGGDNSYLKGTVSWHRYGRTPLGGVLAVRVGAGGVRPYGESEERGAAGVPYDARFFAGGNVTVRGYPEGSLGPQISNIDSLRFVTDVPVPDGASAGGNYLLLANAEWRFPLPLLKKWKLGGVLFLDGGNVWQELRDVRLRGFRWRSFPRAPDDPLATKLWDFRYSVGAGVRLETPFGPVRVDAGFPLKRAQLAEGLIEDRYVVHFSLGYPF